jgi:epoxyqueuosine reductase
MSAMTESTPETPESLKELLRKEALALGFAALGIAPARPLDKARRFAQWLDAGYCADMEWLRRDPERRLDSRLVLPDAQSLVCVAMNYHQEKPKRRGQIAEYALGGDYHKMISNRLKRLCEILRKHGATSRPYCDTGPVLEKCVSEAAGIGWQGKNTCLVNERLGCRTFLGVIVTTAILPPDSPAENRCGRCERCLKACPTGALGNGLLDARKCISFLTIENRGAIPEELRDLIGDRLYGCDSCTSVCPWNRFAKKTEEPRFSPRLLPDPARILAWSREDFDAATAGMALRRAGYDGILRNACVVLGNIGNPDDIAILREAEKCGQSIVEEHAAWAIKRILERQASNG